MLRQVCGIALSEMFDLGASPVRAMRPRRVTLVYLLRILAEKRATRVLEFASLSPTLGSRRLFSFNCPGGQSSA